MLALAAVNRWRLSPRVAAGDAAALRTLSRNAVLETAVGIAVIAIVGVLGITIPAIHRHQHDLHSGTSPGDDYSSPLHSTRSMAEPNKLDDPLTESEYDASRRSSARNAVPQDCMDLGDARRVSSPRSSAGPR